MTVCMLVPSLDKSYIGSDTHLSLFSDWLRVYHSCCHACAAEAGRNKTNNGMPEVLVLHKALRPVCFCYSQLDERQWQQNWRIRSLSKQKHRQWDFSNTSVYPKWKLRQPIQIQVCTCCLTVWWLLHIHESTYSTSVLVVMAPLYLKTTPHVEVRFQESAGGYSRAGATPI